LPIRTVEITAKYKPFLKDYFKDLDYTRDELTEVLAQARREKA